METATLAVVLISSERIITDLDGATGRLGLERSTVGQSWETVFAPWGIPPLPKPTSGQWPRRFAATAPTGHRVVAEVFHLERAGDDGGFIAVLQPEDSITLTDRQQQWCGLGELTAGVAHEINNALTLVHGWLDLLHSDMDVHDPSRDTIRLLIGESERMGRLTSNLLQVARGINETHTPIDLSTLVNEVLSLVQYEMKNADIRIECRLPEDLPQVSGSTGRLKQAVLNLLVNARQAMPSGGKVSISVSAEGNSHLVLSVEDTGCGIPAEVGQRVFHPFFTTKQNGTGLGLPVTRKIVEEHGGILEFESEANAGTRFTVKLPAVRQNDD